MILSKLSTGCVKFSLGLVLLTLSFAARGEDSLRETFTETQKGHQVRCISDLGGVENKRCWKIKPIKITEIDNPQANMTSKLEIREVSKDHQSVVIEIHYEAQGDEVRFSGPDGEIFAIGEVDKKGSVLITDFVDGSLTNELDRAALFGVYDNPDELKRQTIQWLQAILTNIMTVKESSKIPLP